MVRRISMQSQTASQSLKVDLRMHGGRIVRISTDSMGKIHASYRYQDQKNWVELRTVKGIGSHLKSSEEIVYWQQELSFTTGQILGDELHLCPRLLGGMTRGEDDKGTVPGSVGFLTRTNYKEMAEAAKEVVNTAGTNAQATIMVGGREVRGTIQLASAEAERLFGRANEELRLTTEQVGNSAVSAAARLGRETRETTDYVADRVRSTMESANRDVRETGRYLGDQAMSAATHLAGQGRGVIDHGQAAAVHTIDHASGAVMEGFSHIGSVGSGLLRDVDFTTNNMGQQVKGCIHETKSAASGLIKEAGEAASLVLGTAATGGTIPLITAGFQMGGAAFNAAGKGFDVLKGVSDNIYIGRMRETIRVAGEEIRSVVRAADEAIANVGGEARQTILAAGMTAQETSSLMAFQLETILNHAGREAALLLEDAGTRTERVIESAANQARDTVFLASSGAHQVIQQASHNTSLLISQGGREVQDILKTANREARLTIEEAGAQYQERTQAIIQTAFASVDRVLTRIHDNVYRSVDTLTTRVFEEANGLVLNFGNQGRLLIRDMGDELRMSANTVLANAFKGQALLIEAGGKEMRLTLQEGVREIRSILQDIPAIAAATGEAFAKGAAYGILDQVWGVKDDAKIRYHIDKLFIMQAGPIPVTHLIEYVGEQRQLPPAQKYGLYKLLVELYNVPGIEAQAREHARIFIGVAALQDTGLIEGDGRIRSGTNYQNKLLDEMPGNAPDILRKEGVNAIERYTPQPVALTGTSNPLLIEAATHALVVRDMSLRTAAVEEALDDSRRENALMTAEYRRMMQMLTTAAKILKETQQIAATAQQTANTAQQEIGSLKAHQNKVFEGWHKPGSSSEF